MSIKQLISEGGENTILMVTPTMLQEFARSVVDELGKSSEEAKYTPSEFAKRKGVAKSTLHRWRKTGLLKPYMVGSKVYYRDSDLVEG